VGIVASLLAMIAPFQSPWVPALIFAVHHVSQSTAP
jgi:uncharacterized membrane protein HdeD (DUF308 family)